MNIKISIAMVAVMLTACADNVGSSCQPDKDWAMESFGVDIPKPFTINLAKLEVETISAQYHGPVPMIAAVLNGNYNDAQSYWENIGKISDSTEKMRALYAARYSMQGRGFYLVDAAQAWEKAHPESKAARLFLGIAWAEASTEARQSRYVHDTTAEQFNLQRIRWMKAEPILQSLIIDDDFYSWAAMAASLSPYFYMSRTEEGWKGYEYLINKSPQYGWLYLWLSEYTKPKWAGEKSLERINVLKQLAEKYNLNSTDKKVLNQEIDYIVNRVEENSDPTAWQPYWKQRVADAPHNFNNYGILAKQTAVENWPEVLKTTANMLQITPQNKDAWYWRSMAIREIGSQNEAFSANLSAATLGKDWNMSNIVYSFIQGRLGRAQGDFQAMYEYCKMGSAFGLASAANCIASSYTDGFAGVQKDRDKSLSWHMLAARGGNSNSQHDLAVLLPQMKSDPNINEASHFWLRQSAAQGHEYAKKKLAALGESGNDPCEPVPSVREKVFVFIMNIVRIFIKI